MKSYPKGTRASTKLHLPWKGPVQVVSNNGSDYALRNLVTGKLLNRHISLLKAFDSTRCSPIDAARRDTNHYIVDKVVDHKPKGSAAKRQQSKMKFKIRWLGYGPEDDTYGTWEPRSNVSTNVALKYCEA